MVAENNNTKQNIVNATLVGLVSELSYVYLFSALSFHFKYPSCTYDLRDFS